MQQWWRHCSLPLLLLHLFSLLVSPSWAQTFPLVPQLSSLGFSFGGSVTCVAVVGNRQLFGGTFPPKNFASRELLPAGGDYWVTSSSHPMDMAVTQIVSYDSQTAFVLGLARQSSMGLDVANVGHVARLEIRGTAMSTSIVFIVIGATQPNTLAFDQMRSAFILYQANYDLLIIGGRFQAIDGVSTAGCLIAYRIKWDSWVASPRQGLCKSVVLGLGAYGGYDAEVNSVALLPPALNAPGSSVAVIVGGAFSSTGEAGVGTDRHGGSQREWWEGLSLLFC